MGLADFFFLLVFGPRIEKLVSAQGWFLLVRRFSIWNTKKISREKGFSFSSFSLQTSLGGFWLVLSA